MKPRMFIGSSVDHLDLAYAVQEGLEHDVEPTVWSQGVFNLSRSAMASLIDELDDSDFGCFVLAPSDVTEIKDDTKKTVRDNVIFELGLFIGRLGPERCFMIVPRGVEDLHLPTDLLGITPATFNSDRQDGNLVAALGPACNRIRKAVAKSGAVQAVAQVETVVVATVQQDDEAFCSDPEDCKAILRSWMDSRSARDNQKVIRLAQVDRELRLEPGATRKYIKEVASRWDYRVVHEGQDTILFEQDRARYMARRTASLF